MVVHDTGKWCGMYCTCSIHYACDMIYMQWHLALYMHGDITLNGCGCMISESKLCLVFDGGLGALGQRPAKSHSFLNGKENMSWVSASRGRFPPRVNNPSIMVRHSPQR